MQSDRTVRSGLLTERLDGGLDATADRLVQLRQGAQGIPGDLDLVSAHRLLRAPVPASPISSSVIASSQGTVGSLRSSTSAARRDQ